MVHLIRHYEASETFFYKKERDNIALESYTFLIIGDGDYCAIHPITPGDSVSAFWATGGSCRLFQDQGVALFFFSGIHCCEWQI